jgi:transposase
MEKWNFILGVDVSKLTLDIHCLEKKIHIRIGNGTEGFKLLEKWCREEGIDLKHSLIAMEYTGGYEYKLMQFCDTKQIQYSRIPGLAIKNSLGIVRGKNDKVDAKRIAQYATEKRSDIVPQSPVNPTIVQLRHLLSFRKRLVRESAGYKATAQERKAMYSVKNNDLLIRMMNKKIKENNNLVKKLEAEMISLVQTDQKILRNYHIISSIKGIGKINALMTIVYTENFTCFDSARSYAVYVGVVPFDNSSGTSLNGRKRVSNLANKELKQELNQAARVAIEWNKDLKQYAQKKLETKPYKLVLNNVKFKLILRMFSLVKRGEFYVDNYQFAA